MLPKGIDKCIYDGSFVDINDVGKEIIIKPIQKNKLEKRYGKKDYIPERGILSV